MTIDTQPTSLWVKITLRSDSTFGRGDGVAGLVDAEVQHDEYGLPFLSGRTLKGLLTAECAEILDALKRSDALDNRWNKAGQWLFGSPGSSKDVMSHMFVGNAELPSDLRKVLCNEFDTLDEKYSDDEKNRLELLKRRNAQRQRNLESLTTLRKQTAMDAKTGAPLRNSLRTMRVIVRESWLIARLDFDGGIANDQKYLLAACVCALHRAGTGRNRGRGLVIVDLFEQEPLADEQKAVTQDLLKEFEVEVRHALA